MAIHIIINCKDYIMMECNNCHTIILIDEKIAPDLAGNLTTICPNVQGQEYHRRECRTRHRYNFIYNVSIINHQETTVRKCTGNEVLGKKDC